MNDWPSCPTRDESECRSECAGIPANPISVNQALARFEKEAVKGICDTGRYQMPYFIWGSGPPLVCIHGVSDTSRSFVLPLSRLSSHFRCIAYDLPTGYRDGARLAKYRHETLADDLHALLNHLKLDRTYVLASSFGSTIALRAMRSFPDRIARAILQGGLAHRPLRRAETILSWILRYIPGPMTRLPKREKMLELVHKHSFANVPEDRWSAFVQWTGLARLSAFGHQARWLGNVDLRQDLPHIRQPVLLIAGDLDTTVPRHNADLLMQHLPSAGLVIIEGCGHIPSYTHPEAMAELIRKFLSPPGKSEECPGAANCTGSNECSRRGG